MAYFKADTVREAASGNWLYIIEALAPRLEAALKKPGRHVPCPVHGGKDGFRVFRKNFLETGGGICNTCGPRHDGFELLMWINDWDFKHALQAVAGYLGVEPEVRRSKNQEQRSKSDKSPKQRSEAKPATVKTSQPPASPRPEPVLSTTTSDAEPESNVVPLAQDTPKPWLQEAKEELEKRAAWERTYNASKGIRIQQVWDSSIPLSGSGTDPVRKYFRNRELVLRTGAIDESNSIRFHPKLRYHDEDGNLVGEFPAVICAIRDKDGKLVTLHRTYLTESGKKAKVPNPKKMMPIPDELDVNGAAIRLVEPVGGVLGLAEGVETALSAYRVTQVPIWATVNTALMESFEVPEGVHTVVIWADKDKSLAGETSANVLKARLEEKGLTVHVLLPRLPIPRKAKSVDWNDVLMSQGVLGFPRNLRNVLAQAPGQEAQLSVG